MRLQPLEEFITFETVKSPSRIRPVINGGLCLYLLLREDLEIAFVDLLVNSCIMHNRKKICVDSFIYYYEPAVFYC